MLRPSKQRPEYFARIVAICDAIGCEVDTFPSVLRRMYLDEMKSADEIAEELSRTRPVTAKTVSRWLKYIGVSVRPNSEAFRLAASRGRVKWHKKDPLLLSRRKRIGGTSAMRLRYKIMARDGFKCVLCGSTAKEAPLEIDHITAIVNGGTNNPDNLRTVCEACNVGKRLAENER